jgi:hypothetical protein
VGELASWRYILNGARYREPLTRSLALRSHPITQVDATAATISAAVDLASPQFAVAGTCSATGAPAYAGPLERKESLGSLREYAADDTIYRQHETADHWYLVGRQTGRRQRRAAELSDEGRSGVLHAP